MEKKLRFVCGSCGYKFSRHFQPNLCPYCGKAAVQPDNSKGAEDLLREIEEMEEDIRTRSPGH